MAGGLTVSTCGPSDKDWYLRGKHRPPPHPGSQVLGEEGLAVSPGQGTQEPRSRRPPEKPSRTKRARLSRGPGGTGTAPRALGLSLGRTSRDSGSSLPALLGGGQAARCPRGTRTGLRQLCASAPGGTRSGRECQVLQRENALKCAGCGAQGLGNRPAPGCGCADAPPRLQPGGLLRPSGLTGQYRRWGVCSEEAARAASEPRAHSAPDPDAAEPRARAAFPGSSAPRRRHFRAL